MQIHLADNAGFCYGVKRALDLAVGAPGEKGPWYTLGPLVHNQSVTDYLAVKGLAGLEDIAECCSGGVVIRTHGVGPEVFKAVSDQGLECIDATCPKVKKVQELGRGLVSDGYQLIVIGDREHPEVKGIVSWSGGDTLVIGRPEEVDNLPVYARLAVVCQTTKRDTEFREIVNELLSHAKEIRAFNTICRASSRRQESALRLAGQVEVMLVIGDRSSSNTRSLFKVCESGGVPTYHIESVNDLKRDWFRGKTQVGVTAGASTPDWQIKEVLDWMSELETNVVDDGKLEKDNHEVSFAELEAEMAEAMQDVERGTILKGTVIQVTQDEVMVDVGGKSEAIIPLRELSLRNVNSAHEVVKVGDEVRVMVLRWDDDGTILVSKRRVDQEKSLDVLQEVADQGKTITGTILKSVKGGLIVDVGVAGFLPASQVEDGFVRDLESYVGQELDFEILEFNRTKRRGSQVVLSRRKILEREKQSRREIVWNEIAEGQIRTGAVKRLTDYGAFVDLGGVEGLLHISEIDHIRVNKPSDVLSEGQEIEVCVTGIDRETQRISLSRKKLLKSPWEKIAENYAVGNIVPGKVVRTAAFGAFVELEPGVDGLVHISQLANRRIAKPEEVVQVGQEVQVKVIEIDLEKRRISLSLKQAEEGADQAYVDEFIKGQDESAGDGSSEE